MAFTNTGFIRSMKVTITKTGSDESVLTTTYDGQEAFGAFLAIRDDYAFRRLERNGVDGDWDLRMAAFKAYVLSEEGQTVYDMIQWDRAYVNLVEYDIKLMAVAGSGGHDVVAIAYKDGELAELSETLSIFFDTLGDRGILQIAAGDYSSHPYQLLQDDGDIRNVSNAYSIPSESIHGTYSITVDTVNEWQ